MSLPRERINVLADGRITIPKTFRDKLGIKEKSIFEGYILKDKIVLEVLIR